MPTPATAKPVAQNKSRVARLLRQVQGILKLEMSHEDVSKKLWEALREKYGDPNDEYSWDLPWIVETFDDHVIVTKDGDTFSIPYSFDGDEVALGEPVQVETEYVPVEEPALEPAAATNLARSNAPKGKPMSQTNAPVSGLPIIPATNPLPVPEIDPSLPVEEQIRLAREQAFNAAMDHQRAFEAELARARSEAWEKAQAEMARKQNVVALAQKLTSGTRQFPYSPQDLENVLLKLSDADREIIAPVLEKIHAHGLVNMSEIGSTGAGRGHRELAGFAKPLLRAFLAKGGTVQEFFAANVELGSASQYDLYEFETNAK